MEIKNEKKRNIAALILNILTVLLVLVSVLWFFLPGGSGAGNMEDSGARCFRFFTIDSNIIAALASALMIPYNIKGKAPGWALTLKMVGTSAIALTMTVVIFFLGPTQGYRKMYSGVCLPLHLICPLLCIISFCFLEKGVTFTKKRLLLGVLPSLIYGIIYLSCVVIFRVWPDFYGFNMGGKWYISIVAASAAAYLIALLLGKLHNSSEKHTA